MPLLQIEEEELKLSENDKKDNKTEYNFSRENDIKKYTDTLNKNICDYIKENSDKNTNFINQNNFSNYSRKIDNFGFDFDNKTFIGKKRKNHFEQIKEKSKNNFVYYLHKTNKKGFNKGNIINLDNIKNTFMSKNDYISNYTHKNNDLPIKKHQFSLLSFDEIYNRQKLNLKLYKTQINNNHYII